MVLSSLEWTRRLAHLITHIVALIMDLDANMDWLTWGSTSWNIDVRVGELGVRKAMAEAESRCAANVMSISGSI